MKRNLLILAALLTLSAGALHAQWNPTGNLTIVGTMPVITQIQVLDNLVNLDLSQVGTDVVVGSLRERSNSASGYTVTVTSQNSGALVGDVLSESLNYTLSIGGTTFDVSSGTPVLITDSLARTTAAGSSRNIAVSHGSGDAGGLLLAQDTYRDVLTFEIAPK